MILSAALEVSLLFQGQQKKFSIRTGENTIKNGYFIIPIIKGSLSINKKKKDS